MESDQVARTEMQDVTGERWWFELSLVDGTGLQVFRGGQLLGGLPARTILRLAAGVELAEDHAAAVLGELAGTSGCILPASIYAPFHAVLSCWLWERAPFGD